MTDIVERLRAMPSSFNDALRTMEEAADEITLLRHTELKMAAELIVLETVLQKVRSLPQRYIDRIDRAVAEIRKSYSNE